MKYENGTTNALNAWSKNKMKKLKLWIHSKEFDEHELVLNPKEFPDIQMGDIFEIYHPEDDKDCSDSQPRVLLQVNTIRDDFTQKDVISIEQTVANAFNLRNYKDMYVNKVEFNDVTLDLVEVIFKEQYVGRADMWHIKKLLVNSCAYLNKKVEFFNARMQVREMWSKGERVACGAISDNTRLVFRSSTASVAIFIQMSIEMWEFDFNGDLYFEKSVSGFLAELFARWKDSHCNHDATIVLFSRVYYQANSIDDFPPHMRNCILQSSSGKFYEDYYMVPIQNERYEDWAPALMVLKKLFNVWKEKIMNNHKIDSTTKIPAGELSTASQGNYLEVLNLSLNLYDKSYIDRIFDHTGQVTTVISAGSGVFEVDRDLAHLTKQRTIDNGIGSDLVCMGEQPLHIVPLFKYADESNTEWEYYVPHWINLSYFRTDHGFLSSFTPRIRVPDLPLKSFSQIERKSSKLDLVPEEATSANGVHSDHVDVTGSDVSSSQFEDFDEYDASVFNWQNTSTKLSKSRNKSFSRNSSGGIITERTRTISDEFVGMSLDQLASSVQSSNKRRDETANSRAGSSNFLQTAQIGSLESEGSVDNLISAVLGATTIKERHQLASRLAAALDPFKAFSEKIKQRPLNPFAPSLVHFKMSSNRRRWVHAFPITPDFITCIPSRSTHSSECEPEHQVATQTPNDHSDPVEILPSGPINPFLRTSSTSSILDPNENDCKSPSSVESSESMLTAIRAPASKGLHRTFSQSHSLASVPSSGILGKSKPPSQGNVKAFDLNFGKGCGSGGTSVDLELNARAGVDWKALIIPACLPITTDFVPKKDDLEKEFFINEYSVYPYDYWETSGSLKTGPLTVYHVFETLVSQRLAKGFQIIHPLRTSALERTSRLSPPTMASKGQMSDVTEEYLLSIGRIFHRISLCGNIIKVAVYRPRKTYASNPFDYRYQFQVPDSDDFSVSMAFFSHVKLENFNWNYTDNYITVAINPETRKEGEFSLIDSMNYWRSRFLLLPCTNPAVKKIMDGETKYCDIYLDQQEEEATLVDGFMRFMEIINRLRRPLRKSKKFSICCSNANNSPSRRVSAPLLGLPQVNVRPVRRLNVLHNSRVEFRGEALKEVTREAPLGLTLVPILEAPASTFSSTNSLEERKTSSDSATFSRSSSLQERDSYSMECPIMNDSDAYLHIHSPINDILTAMTHPTEGLCFLPKKQPQGIPELPNKCFIAAECVDWVCIRVEGINSIAHAVNFLQRFIDEGLFRHLCGLPEFHFGIYFYYIVEGDPKREGSKDAILRDELMEVSLFLNHLEGNDLKVPRFLWPRLPKAKPSHAAHKTCDSLSVSPFISGSSSQRTSTTSTDSSRSWAFSKPIYKNISFSPDVNEKSSWPEWGRLRYMSSYNPSQPFELEFQWLVASGPLMSDLVTSWARKIKSNPGVFHLLPIPDDPFCQPSQTLYTDPLRSPIFIDLNIEAITGPDGGIFSDFSEDTRLVRLQMFQEEILKRFGFMEDLSVATAPCNLEISPKTSVSGSSDHLTSWRYVHMSGGFFAGIPVYNQASLDNSFHSRFSSEPRVVRGYEIPFKRKGSKEFRLSLGTTEPSTIPSSSNRVGFFWAWNFLLSRRWRTGNTGDRDVFPDRVLDDFKSFCANSENRLAKFWDSCLQSLNEPSFESLIEEINECENE